MVEQPFQKYLCCVMLATINIFKVYSQGDTTSRYYIDLGLKELLNIRQGATLPPCRNKLRMLIL